MWRVVQAYCNKSAHNGKGSNVISSVLTLALYRDGFISRGEEDISFGKALSKAAKSNYDQHSVRYGKIMAALNKRILDAPVLKP